VYLNGLISTFKREKDRAPCAAAADHRARAVGEFEAAAALIPQRSAQIFTYQRIARPRSALSVIN